MAPVGGQDLPGLVALKGDPLVFAQMLGGVRGPRMVAVELAEDIRAWGEFGFGMWSVRARAGGGFLGVTGLMQRADGLGVALRFALWPSARGGGLASEAAGAALNYAHEVAGLRKIVAVAREANFASRMVLGAVGMTQMGGFIRQGVPLLIYQSVRNQNAW